MSAEIAIRDDSASAAGSDAITRASVPHVQIVEEDSFEAEAGAVHRARWQLFLPTLVITALYAAAWLYLAQTGRSGGGLAKLVLLVIAVGVPLLTAHAFLRHQTIRVQARGDALRYHPGWPRDLPVDLPYALIERIWVKRGIAGRLFGGGTLVIELTTGARVAIADLSDPDAALAGIVPNIFNAAVFET